MIADRWLESVLSAADAWLGMATGRESCLTEGELISLAGVGPPQSEIQRLLLIGVVTDLGRKALTARPTVAIDQALEYMRRHSRTSKVTRVGVARAVGVCDSWLAHGLKRSTGRSFRDHLNHFRTEDALQLLKSSTESIKCIAVTVGFTNASVFTKCFTRHVGVSPKDWRHTQERAK